MSTIGGTILHTTWLYQVFIQSAEQLSTYYVNSPNQENSPKQETKKHSMDYGVIDVPYAFPQVRHDEKTQEADRIEPWLYLFERQKLRN